MLRSLVASADELYMKESLVQVRHVSLMKKLVWVSHVLVFTFVCVEFEKKEVKIIWETLFMSH